MKPRWQAISRLDMDDHIHTNYNSNGPLPLFIIQDMTFFISISSPPFDIRT